MKLKDCLNWNQRPNYMKVKGWLEKKVHEVKWIYEKERKSNGPGKKFLKVK